MTILTYEQAKKLCERNILSNNSIIMVNIPAIKNKNCFINKIINDTKNKKIMVDIIFQEIIPNNREPFFIPHTLISKIENMPVEKILEAYDMSENNKIEEIDIETDVVNEVIGKKEGCVDGIELKEGKRFIFLNDVTPKYNNRIFTVKYDNDNNIKLIANRGRPKKIS